ncbi:Arc family DNA-binding protein [Martelella lutilitoris]|uniref:Arc family DNA-binding protein n=1 Tax=Martelella lutilitoris TaxID=2583532 RepID=A0A5C4JTD8_9HYPH|nr:Arc family DNA-binding protein [Martelella lutilitoris]
MQTDIAPFGLRMQAPLKEKIKEAAEKNGRSMNAEIIYRLEEYDKLSAALDFAMINGDRAHQFARTASTALTKVVEESTEITNQWVDLARNQEEMAQLFNNFVESDNNAKMSDEKYEIVVKFAEKFKRTYDNITKTREIIEKYHDITEEDATEEK